MEPDLLGWDRIRDSMHLDELSEIVELDGQVGVTKLEMIVTSGHFKLTHFIHSSLPKKLSECVREIDRYRCLDERLLIIQESHVDFDHFSSHSELPKNREGV